MRSDLPTIAAEFARRLRRVEPKGGCRFACIEPAQKRGGESGGQADALCTATVRRVLASNVKRRTGAGTRRGYRFPREDTLGKEYKEKG